jgi:hypothetical protein
MIDALRSAHAHLAPLTTVGGAALPGIVPSP